MDGGEATPARPVTVVHTTDLVKFEPAAGAHGDRGLAFPTAGEPSALVLCADGTLVTRELRDLTVVDRGRGGATLVHGYAREYPTISAKQ